MDKPPNTIDLTVHVNRRDQESREVFLSTLKTCCDAIAEGLPIYEGFALVAWGNAVDSSVSFYLPRGMHVMQLPSLAHDIILADLSRDGSQSEIDVDES